MIISQRHRFAFISTMKCATNSLTHALLTRYQGAMPGDLHERRMDWVPPGYFTFSVCRNPYTRAVSLWWSTCMRHDLDRYGFRKTCADPDRLEGFMQWVLGLASVPHDLLLTQSEWHRHTRIDRFLRVEHLEAEFAALPFVPAGEKLEMINATVTDEQGMLDVERLKADRSAAALSARPQRRRESADAYLTPRAASLIRQWAAEDFVRFGYSTDPQLALEVDGSGQAGAPGRAQAR